MDTISQFITVIRNAGVAKHEKLDVPASKLRAGIAQILVNEGYIRSFKIAKDSKQGIMRIYLKYDDLGNHVITAIDRISRPGRRVYVQNDKVPSVRSGLGFSILSTSQGIIGSKQAKDKKLGGEILCSVW
ncbi:MAG: 30S ribosomal protein S8 [Bdellovibrionota bacterium]